MDLVLSNNADKMLMQCKQWKAFKVGVDTVRKLYGVMVADGDAAGIVLTSGNFTQDAEAFAAGRNIRLINGDVLMKLLHEVRVQAGAALVARLHP